MISNLGNFSVYYHKAPFLIITFTLMRQKTPCMSCNMIPSNYTPSKTDTAISCSPTHPGGGGGGTHPGFWYPLQNRPRELWLSTRSKLEKGGLSLTQVLSEGVGGGGGGVAVVFGLSSPRKAFWISYD